MAHQAHDPEEIADSTDSSAGEAMGVRSVLRAVEILQLLDEDRPVFTIRDVMQNIGLAKTTATRLIHTLVHAGILWATDAGYTAGPGLWRWAHLAQRAWELPPEAQALMFELARGHQETVNVYVTRGITRLCIAQAESSRPLRHVVNVGDEFPLWAGATGKVLLAEADETVLQRVAANVTSEGPDLQSLRAQIDAVRRAGYAVSHGEREAGVSAVGVPVRDHSGRCVMALGISGASVRFTEDRVARFAESLRLAADEMSTMKLSWIVVGARS